MSPLGRTQSGDHSRTTSVTSTPAFASPRMIIRIERSTVRIPYSGERRANGKTSDAEAPVRSPFWGTLATERIATVKPTLRAHNRHDNIPNAIDSHSAFDGLLVPGLC